jgi:undecaprenyl-diphosphatase
MLQYPPTLGSLDSTLFLWINAHHTAVLDYLFTAITQFGNGWVTFPFVASILYMKLRTRRCIKPVILLLVCLTISGLVNNLVKRVSDRPRPLDYYPVPMTVHVIGDSLHQKGFPSGHTNTAFSAATVLWGVCGPRFWPAYIIAAAVAYSRVYFGAHFPSDTIGGAIIGYSISMACIAVYRRIFTRENKGTGPPGSLS